MPGDPSPSTGPGVAPRLVCAGCGWQAPANDLYPFRCPRARRHDDIDHLLRRVFDPAAVADARALFADPEPNPFRKFRRLLASYHLARSGGLSDGDYAGLVDELDRAVRQVDGVGFRETPCRRSEGLARELGLDEIWIKDETGNVSGSHKGRHLMGLALWLRVAERLGGGSAQEAGDRPLAIASCGNAALAAAVVARAAGRRLDVFVPPDAHPRVVGHLSELGARLTTCPRQGGVAGDPCYHRFRQAIDGGSLPFTCQGSENGLIIEGGQTLAWEMVAALLRHGGSLDRLFVQVGGGALATACIQGLREARDLGLIPQIPRIHAVQTLGAYPLFRSWERLAERIVARCLDEGRIAEPPPADPAIRAEVVASAAGEVIAAELRYAATHRSEFMWPWEEPPHSIATGILDDETYDWLAVVEGMLTTGGFPVVVSEEILAEANGLAQRTTQIAVDPTGSSGLAGLLELLRTTPPAPTESIGVLFTGVAR